MMDENRFFREMTLKICGSLEIEHALYACFLYLRELFPVDAMVLSYFDGNAGLQRHLAEATADGGRCLDVATPLSPELLADLNAQIAHGRLPLIEYIAHPEQHPITRLVVKRRGKAQGSLIIIRLILQGQFLGSLAVVRHDESLYTQEQIALLACLREPFAIALSNAVRYREVLALKEILADENRDLQAELQRLSGAEMIGAEVGLSHVMTLVRQVAPLSSPVLLLGETGTGKELLANALHQGSPRKNRPFIKVNCGAIPATLIDSELFGHEKGAFTGAIHQKRGCFERAHSGTIFLDEIGELPPDAQVRLLRILQEKEFERVGGMQPIKIDIRVIAATHRDLSAMIANGEFREDLYFRLNVFPIRIPPLRERPDDIPILVQHFIQKKMREMAWKGIPLLADGAMERLMSYQWPGNVRELENAVERALILSGGKPLTFTDIRPAQADAQNQSDHADSEEYLNLQMLNAQYIQKILTVTSGKIEGKGGAAEMLDIHPNTLRHRLRKLGIPFGRNKKPSQGSAS